MTNDQQPPAEPAATVEVALGERSYTIHIGERAIERAGALVRPLLTRPFCVIVSDANVAERHLASLQAALAASGIKSAAAIVAPGETSKGYAGLSDLCEELLAAGISAPTWSSPSAAASSATSPASPRRSTARHRLCPDPTTLLAQVDSRSAARPASTSARGKNLIGAFHQPRLVLADLSLLDTLPPREMRAGYAEVIKYGLLGDCALLRMAGGERPPTCSPASPRPWPRRRAIGAGEGRRSSPPTRRRRAAGPCSISATPSATPWRPRPASASGLIHGEAVAIGMLPGIPLLGRLGLLPARTPRASRRPSPRLGLPTDAGRHSGAPLPRRRTDRTHAPGQEGRGRTPDLRAARAASARPSSAKGVPDGAVMRHS